MARDTHVLKDFEARLRDAGGTFMRMTGKGYRRWHLKNGKQVVIVDLPTKGYEYGHLRKNVEAEIKRAVRACGRLPREVKVERAQPAAAPVQVAEEVSAPPSGSGGGDQAPDVARDADPLDADRRDTDLGGDAARGPEEEAQGLLGDPDPAGTGTVQEAVGGNRREVAGPTAPHTCERCGAGFARAVDRGRHLRQRHGIEGTTYQAKWSREKNAKAAKVDEDQADKVAISATPAARQSGPGWRFAEAPARPVLTGPPPLGMTRPTATLVAGTATMEKVAALAEALAAAARDLVTEYRLVREENTRLTEAVQQMERMFDGLRRR